MDFRVGNINININIFLVRENQLALHVTLEMILAMP